MTSQPDFVDVTVNGEARGVLAATSLADLVHELSPTGAGCAVAVNGEVAPRADWRHRVVAPGDQIEILTAVQGG
ncbi:MAG TPA: sulfur carrier protein ThiS [Mycobacteriales bacterium]|nr:sulfur carrier protein ThiS [Mycobacteriales bacterium]